MREVTQQCILIARLTIATRSLFISSLFVQNVSKSWKTKHSCIELFIVFGMFTHSRWCCLQRCECSMHNCTFLSFEVLYN